MANNNRILIVTQHYWPENFRITDIAEGLVENGFKVDVLCGIPNYPTGKYFKGYSLFTKLRQKQNGVKIIRVLELPRGSNSNLQILLNYISFTLFALLYVPILLTRKYDKVLSYQLSPIFMTFPAILFSKITKAPLYIYICDFWPYQLFSIKNINSEAIKKIITRVSYWHYRKADGLIATFKGVQDRLVSDVNIPKHKTIYIPQAPEKLYETAIYDYRLKKRFSNSFNIVFAGSINPAQSFETIIKAAKILSASSKINLKFIIVGDGMSKKWLESEVKKLKISKLFVFEGTKPVEEIPKYHKIADVLLVALSKSSIYEYTIPAKVNSYMASGKPIVGAMNGEAQKLINLTANCGICVDSENHVDLARAIIKMSKMSKYKRKILGKNGRDYYNKFFERNSNLQRLINFISK